MKVTLPENYLYDFCNAEKLNSKAVETVLLNRFGVFLE